MTRSIGSFGFDRLAPEGFYIALRVGFAYPMAEHNSFPEAWIETYTAQGFMLSDPVMRWVYGNSGTTRWSEITLDDPLAILAHAAEHGLRHGAAVSVWDESGAGQRSFGSFARADREFTDAEISDLRTRMQQLHDSTAPPQRLTEAELEALRLVKNGLLLKQIADELGVSEGAVKQRLRNAKAKLKARNSTQAATIAMEYGLI